MYREDRKNSLAALNEEIVNCSACPRLVEWRERIAVEKVRRFRDQQYWGKPVASFGDPRARLLVIGLAPAAHGANRTGRMFTGDRSGEWLYRALYSAGFANQPVSRDRRDGLHLRDCYIAAVIHCAPPGNKPLPVEIQSCRSFLLREAALLDRLQVAVALGSIAFRAALDTLDTRVNARRAKFAHGAEHELSDGKTLLASFHPSQQNTFTGRLTEPMLDYVFERASSLLK